MRKLLIHIGTEKTGSTSIQHFLAQNDRTLLALFRILYPKSESLFQHPAHFPVAASFLDASECEFVAPEGRIDPARLPEILAQEYDKAGAALMVLSAEQLSSRLGEPQIRAFANALKGFDVTLLVYVRRQDEMALSTFATAVLCGHRPWLDLGEVHLGSRHYDLETLLDPWASHFDERKIRVRPFEKRQLHHGDVVRDFLIQLGVPSLNGLVKVDRMNRSPTIKQLRILSRLNQGLPTWQEAFDNNRIDDYNRAQTLRRWVLQLTGQLERFSSSTPTRELLCPEQRTEIAERFRTSNASVAQRFLGREHLFSEIEAADGSTHNEVGASAPGLEETDLLRLIEKSFDEYQELATKMAARRTERDLTVDEIENDESVENTPPRRSGAC
jgi:hypothetical protein